VPEEPSKRKDKAWKRFRAEARIEKLAVEAVLEAILETVETVEREAVLEAIFEAVKASQAKTGAEMRVEEPAIEAGIKATSEARHDAAARPRVNPHALGVKPARRLQHYVERQGPNALEQKRRSMIVLLSSKLRSGDGIVYKSCRGKRVRTDVSIFYFSQKCQV
jgi:hypothetical protein